MDSTCEHRSRPDDRERAREREWVTRLRRMREERVVGFAAVVCIACTYGWRSEEGGRAARRRRRRRSASAPNGSILYRCRQSRDRGRESAAEGLDATDDEI